MQWSWELSEWPRFDFDREQVSQMERMFLLKAGESAAVLRSVSKRERDRFIVDILTSEGFRSAKIEGEELERESLQSSIKRHFGLKGTEQEEGSKERGMARLMCEVYDTWQEPLSTQMLERWHHLLFDGQQELADIGKYRTHLEPMQIVSGKLGAVKVFYEAPPSSRVPEEMERFIEWFNSSKDEQSILIRASIAHLYFEIIHPFEDGNGRIGRAIVEKALSQGIGHPVLIAVSAEVERKKKGYYRELGFCNRSLRAADWVSFFSERILLAQERSMKRLNLLIQKASVLRRLEKQLNKRQEKALLKLFDAGVDGFQGGLSSGNYQSMTKCSPATATRDLHDLVQKGALRKTSSGRHTRYWLNKSSHSRVLTLALNWLRSHV